MALLAMRSQSRSALAALAMLGLVAIVIALGFDLPDATGIATLRSFQDARLAPRTGFYLETLGAALVAVAAVGGLLLASPSRDRRPARR
jgi:O-antigen ligase